MNPVSFTEITLQDVTTYLGAKGWRRREAFPRPELIVFDGPEDDGGEAIQAVIPAGTAYKDFYVRLSELLGTLAVIENRSPDEIASDMLLPRADRLQVRGDRLWNSPSILDYPKLRLIIAPDLRFIREANAIHSLSGINVLLRRDGVTWDGHINEALAQIAQHRDEALATQLGCHYAATNAMSITTNRRIFDCDVDNPVSRRQVEPATEQQRRQLDNTAAAILDRAIQGKH